MVDINAFNFDAMKKKMGTDPFEEQKNSKYKKDDRYYKLTRDEENKTGGAIVRFLPDSDGVPFRQITMINTNIHHKGEPKERFVSCISPQSADLPCPFQERWVQQANKGIKEDLKDSDGNILEYGSDRFKRSFRYVANIKVISDPLCPENEGKIFLYSMSKTMLDKIRLSMNPSATDIAIGTLPKQPFNPFKGHSFALQCSIGANGHWNYNSSRIADAETSIYGDTPEEHEAGLEELNTKTYRLADLVKPENLPTYEELQAELKRVTWEDRHTANVSGVASVSTQPAQPSQPAQPAQASEFVEVHAAQPTPQPSQQPDVNSENLDSMLDELM